jgi:hypothetical protein
MGSGEVMLRSPATVALTLGAALSGQKTKVTDF